VDKYLQKSIGYLGQPAGIAFAFIVEVHSSFTPPFTPMVILSAWENPVFFPA
jgi:hypothetical protein